MTEFLVNPSFEYELQGWQQSNVTSGWAGTGTWSDRPAHEGSSFASFAFEKITSVDVYQTVSGLPAGTYSMKAALRNTGGKSYITDQHVYATTAAGTVESTPLTDVSGDNNNDWYDFTVTDIVLKDGEALRLGARSTGSGTQAGWFQVDDFRLYYWGTSGSTGIDSPLSRTDVALTVSVSGGRLVVSSPTACRLPVYTVGGAISAVVSIQPGQQSFSLPSGQYVVGGKVVSVP